MRSHDFILVGIILSATVIGCSRSQPTPPEVDAEFRALLGTVEREPSGASRSIRVRFFASPVAILGTEKVEGIEIAHTELVAGDDGRPRAVPTGERETIDCGIVFRSVGYRGVPVVGVPFDEARFCPN